MTDIDRSRDGLNALLDMYPDAKVVLIKHQGKNHLLGQQRHGNDVFQMMFYSDGPWTEVTLYHQDGRTDKAFREYAIWNRTGAVHDMEDGAVIDPPLVKGRTS